MPVWTSRLATAHPATIERRFGPMLRAFLRFGVLVLALVIPSRALAVPIVINFDALGELDSVTTQFPGVTFSNATVLTAGSTLNELETPPHSGANAIFDDGGPMSLVFGSPFYSFGGYFSYSAPLTISAFDSTNALLGSVSSLFSNNFLVSGDAGSSPNEFLQLSFATPIASLTIAGDPAGGSLVLDDVTLDSAAPTPAPVPEPSTLSLLGLGVVMLARKARSSLRGR